MRAKKDTTSIRALKKAISIVGSQSALAEKIQKNALYKGKNKVSQATVWKWLNSTKQRVPAEFVLAIESVTGVKRNQLRADIYPFGL